MFPNAPRRLPAAAAPAAARALAILATALALSVPAWSQPVAATGGKVGRTTDDVTTSNAPARDDVGQGGRMGARLKPGAYIGEKHRAAVRRYYAQHHGAGQACPPGTVKKAGACEAAASAVQWAIGEKLPAAAGTRPVPQAIAALLPRTPPGNRYVLVGPDILLMAVPSRMVVDGIDGLAAP